MMKKEAKIIKFKMKDQKNPQFDKHKVQILAAFCDELMKIDALIPTDLKRIKNV